MKVEDHVLESFLSSQETVRRGQQVHEFLASTLRIFNASEYRALWNRLLRMQGCKEKSDSSTRSAIDHMRHSFTIVVRPGLTPTVEPGAVEEASGRATTTYEYVKLQYRVLFQGLPCPDSGVPLIEEYKVLLQREDELRERIAAHLAPHTPHFGSGLFDTPAGPVMLSGARWFRAPAQITR